METKNTAGSCWNKWDLHIHTPGTSKNDQFGTSEQVWDEYINALEALDDIKVLGITDYFSMKNYLRLKTEQDEKGRLVGKILLPNIELRIVPVTDHKKLINFHVIFDSKLAVADIKREFFGNLKYQTGEMRYSCVEEELISLGRNIAHDDGLEPRAAYEKAITQFNVGVHDVANALNKELFRGRYLTFVSNSSNDGNSGIQDGALETTRKEIYRAADIIFSGNPKDANFFLGEDDNNSPEIIKRDYGSLKPCVTGSDAHKFSDIGKFSRNRYTWIKAECSFEGLKQIVFEPKERVKIQEFRPEEKDNYNVIKEVVLKHPDFGEQTIPINQNLTTIIGGRSSGKSLLLAIIAKLAGCLTPAKKDDEKYNELVEEYAAQSKIVWADDSEEGNLVEFYGQNRISDIVKNKEITNEVKRVIEKKPDKKEMLKTYHQWKNENAKKINNLISDYFSCMEDIEATTSELSLLGNKEGIENNILNLIQKKKEVECKCEVKLSETDLNNYNLNVASIKKLKQEIEQLTVDLALLSSWGKIELFATVDHEFYAFSKDVKEKIEKKHKEIREKSTAEWVRYIRNLEDEINNNIAEQRTQVQTIESGDNYKQCQQYYASNEELSDLNKRILNDDNKIKEFNDKSALLEQQKKLASSVEGKILDAHFKFRSKTDELIEHFGNIQVNKITIGCIMQVDSNKMESMCLDCFNQRTGDGKDYVSVPADNISEYEKWATALFEKMVNGEIVLKSNADLQQVMHNIFTTSCFDIDYDLTYDSDSLYTMSEGKQAFVILNLLLEFDDRKCPILIDQPEDDLDNRAIYRELVAYLRNKKKERQIILVTHNPNVVVGADAEEIIVANQKGIDSKNQDQLKFEYLSGSLENSFTDPQVTTVLLSKGIREHVCEILEGGEEAFEKREEKYGYTG